MEKILIVASGGTFDKVYNEKEGTLFFKETHLQEMLRISRSTLDIEIISPFLIDSLHMTDEHRELILDLCTKSSVKKILIIHGTDTMAETAVFLGLNQNNFNGKTVTLTGAMIPYTFSDSDGMFNFAFSLAFLQSHNEGVFVCMNGSGFSWNNVRKNKQLGIFEEISQST